MADICKKLCELGADKAAVVPVEKIVFDASLITLCSMNSCGNYGKCWTCPPLVGETEKLIEKAKAYSKAAVFQKVYYLEDSFDIEGMDRGKQEFDLLSREIASMVRAEIPGVLFLGAGGCRICPVCAAVSGQPCRFPDEAFASLEAYGIQVSELAAATGMKYINGQNTVTYFGAVFYRE